jgi:hypothetical protein
MQFHNATLDYDESRVMAILERQSKGEARKKAAYTHSWFLRGLELLLEKNR